MSFDELSSRIIIIAGIQFSENIFVSATNIVFAQYIQSQIFVIKAMKTSKVSAMFLNKFSGFLAKFKQSSTIAIAHEQIRKLFSEYKFSDIAIAFASKMDSCDQLTQKQKKQYIKIYMTLIDVYGQDIVLEFYDRIVDSIAKKGAGVSEVVGHLCRSLLKRIYPTQNIANYIKHLLISFQRHAEIGKIIKQIVESFDSQIIAPFQSQTAGLINQKIQNAKAQFRIQLLEATLAMILSLQSKFFQQAVVQSFVAKNFKNQQWNVRKLCVDISYALLVINNQANKILHEGVTELKYDKIKHVRDSVGNYTNLHKQIYGEEKQKITQKATDRVFKTQRDSVVNTKRAMTSKSPVIPHKFQQAQSERKSAPKSLQKSIKMASRNEQFFQNAGNKDVIKISQSKSFVFPAKNLRQQKKMKLAHHHSSQTYIIERGDHEIKQEKIVNKVEQNPINFEKYLKTRTDEFLTYSPSQKNANNTLKQEMRIESPKQQKKMNEYSISLEDSVKKQNIENNGDKIFNSRLMEQYESKQKNEQFHELQRDIKTMAENMNKFMSQMMSRFNNLEKRVSALQQNKNKSFDSSELSFASLQKDIKDIKYELGNPDRYLEQSFESRFNELKPSTKQKPFARKQQSNELKQTERKIMRHGQVGVQSNLRQKIELSIRQNNWNEAFSLALTNNSRNTLIELLKYYQIPKDKLVQDCLFVQLRRNLGNWIVLKWLNTFFQQHDISKQKLHKLYKQLQGSEFRLENGDNLESSQKNYSLLKTVLLNEIRSKLAKLQSFEEMPILG